MTSVSRYQSRSSMYIRGQIPRNWPRQFRLAWEERVGYFDSVMFWLSCGCGHSVVLCVSSLVSCDMDWSIVSDYDFTWLYRLSFLQHFGKLDVSQLLVNLMFSAKTLHCKSFLPAYIPCTK